MPAASHWLPQLGHVPLMVASTTSTTVNKADRAAINVVSQRQSVLTASYRCENSLEIRSTGDLADQIGAEMLSTTSTVVEMPVSGGVFSLGFHLTGVTLPPRNYLPSVVLWANRD